MRSETDDMTDSAYFRVAKLLKNKSAYRVKQAYKKIDRQNETKKSLWLRIKSFFLRSK